MENRPKFLTTAVESLRPYMQRTAKVTFDKQMLFESCLKSSFVKTFEFVELSIHQDSTEAVFSSPGVKRHYRRHDFPCFSV